MEIIYRFLLGGALVSLFSVVGDSFKPKSFSGIFAAAPSVALAGLILTFYDQGLLEVKVQTRAMIFGSIALLIYNITCFQVLNKSKLQPWVAASLLWSEWILCGALLWWVFLR